MAESWGEAAARGIESGFNLGLRADEAQQRKDQLTYDRNRQATADARASEELGIKRTADARAERRLADTERRDANTRAVTGLEARRKELLEGATAAQAAGGPVPKSTAEEYASVSSRLRALRQSAVDDASRLATGQLSLDDMPPEQLYKTVTIGTGMSTKDLAAMPQHAADFQAGMETQNNGLVLQSVNGMLAPLLRRGVGQPSPYGGTITRKEIIGLDPARDGAGQDHPNRVIPRLRVYVQRPGDPSEKYYDAPMTQEGSTADDDNVMSIDLNKGMNWVGNLGVLTTALQRPDLQQKLAEGEKRVGPEVQKYFDEFYSLSRPTKKQITRTNTDLGDRVRTEEVDSTGRVIGVTYEKKGAVPKDKFSVAGATMDHRLEKLTDLYETGGLGDPDSKEAQAEYSRRSAEIIQGITSRPKDASTGGGDGKLTPEAVDSLAEAALKDRSVLANIGRGAQGAKDLRTVLNKMAEKSGGTNLANTRADFAADKKSLDKIVPQYDAIEAFTRNAIQQGHVLKELANDVDSTGVPVVERWIRAGRKSLQGDPEVSKFNAQMQIYRTEAARIMTNPNLAGVLTDSARKEVEHFLDGNASSSQISAVVDRLENDFSIRKNTLENQINDIKTRMSKPSPSAKGIQTNRRSSEAPVQIKSNAEYYALPSGTVYFAPDTSRRRKR